MTKGRRFTPSKDRDGIWFRHLVPRTAAAAAAAASASDAESRCHGDNLRTRSTTTGRMLMDPFKAETNSYPPKPPTAFVVRDLAANDFSKHDNRHAFQGHGIYFGNGRDTRLLGKRMGKTFDERPQFTEPDFLTHYGRIITECDYKTIYTDNYRGCSLPLEDSKAFRRRFAQRYPVPRTEGAAGCASGISFESNAPCKTSLETQLISQQPFPKRTERWKYSYHGLPRCYPVLGKVEGKVLSPSPAWYVRSPNSENMCDSANF